LRRCWSIITSAFFSRILLALSLALALGACGRTEAPKFELTDITGADFGKALDLTDHNGQRRTLADFRGKVVVIFFGFTHCPDVCPTTMLELSQVAKALGPDAGKMQVLFVTVDPERDTPEVLRQYIPSFNPAFLGLYGSAEETARAAKEFKVYFHKQPQRGGDYTVDHTAGTYVLDPNGRLRLFAQYGAGAQAFLHDIRVLLREAA
jgi:protein SCO1/2